MRTKDGTKLNRKLALKVYYKQAAFYGVKPKTPYFLSKQSARGIYTICREMHNAQPRAKQKEWAKAVKPKIKKLGWFGKLIRKLGYKKRVKKVA